METLVRIAVVGTGATVLMDLWALVQHRAYGAAALDYRLVGRWLGHISSGRLSHGSIAKAVPIPGEQALGWAAHYAIGILFAALLVALFGSAWMNNPSIWPALGVGAATVAAPFLILQPALGLGVAASKTPDPTAARLRSCINHLIFGLGLYLSADLTAGLFTG